MQCEHTGCVAFSYEYGCYFRGDLYRTEQGTYILKAVSKRFYEPPQPNYHLAVYEIEALWGDLTPYWVIIIDSGQYLGYDGKPAVINSHRVVG